LIEQTAQLLVNSSPQAASHYYRHVWFNPNFNFIHRNNSYHTEFINEIFKWYKKGPGLWSVPYPPETMPVLASNSKTDTADEVDQNFASNVSLPAKRSADQSYVSPQTAVTGTQSHRDGLSKYFSALNKCRTATSSMNMGTSLENDSSSTLFKPYVVGSNGSCTTENRIKSENNSSLSFSYTERLENVDYPYGKQYEHEVDLTLQQEEFTGATLVDIDMSDFKIFKELKPATVVKGTLVDQCLKKVSQIAPMMYIIE
jgi:hypothetical protein